MYRNDKTFNLGNIIELSWMSWSSLSPSSLLKSICEKNYSKFMRLALCFRPPLVFQNDKILLLIFDALIFSFLE
jgi:hypothetical protein